MRPCRVILLLVSALACNREGAHVANDSVDTSTVAPVPLPAPSSSARAITPAVAAETTITFGVITRDLTGDTIPEVITLTGRGQSFDDLAISFTIQSSGRPLYARTWRLARQNYDGGRRPTEAEHRAQVSEYGKWFFDDRKFRSPEGFLTFLRSSARLHIPLIPEVISRQMSQPDTTRARMLWEQMQTAGITIFEFSPGGDAALSIGWSPTDKQFYNLLECC